MCAKTLASKLNWPKIVETSNDIIYRNPKSQAMRKEGGTQKNLKGMEGKFLSLGKQKKSKTIK